MKNLEKNIKDYQLSPAKYMVYEQDIYTSYQNYLYKRALYGLKSLSQEEIEVMCNKKKQRINNVYNKAQSVLNIAKQKATIYYTNLLFERLFPNSPLTDFLLTNIDTDINFKNTLTFKDLNLSKEQIITIFMQEGILPKNFKSLKEDPNLLPKLKNA